MLIIVKLLKYIIKQLKNSNIYSDHFLIHPYNLSLNNPKNSFMPVPIKVIFLQYLLISAIASSPILDPSKLQQYMFTQFISGDLQFLEPTQLFASNNWPNPIEIYEITAIKAQHQFLPESFPSTTIYSYAGKVKGEFKTGYPGVSLRGFKNMPLYVTYTNKIIGRHFLPLDFSIPFDMVSRFFQNQVPIVPHAHGLETQMGSDGQPMGFWSNSGAKGPDYFSHKSTNKSINQGIFRYHNTKQGLYWIHDHTMAITRLNVYAGMASFFQIIDPQMSEEQRNVLQNLGELERKYFVIADKTFKEDGSLYYPNESQSSFYTSWVPEFFGNTITVNGKVWPKIRLEPKQYRFVFLNACQSRFLNLFFESNNIKLNFQIIRRDSDYLREPVNVREHLLVLGGRVQIVIDLRYVKDEILIGNDAPTPYPMGDDPDQFDGSVMKIVINQQGGQKLDKTVNTVPSLIMERINFYLEKQQQIKSGQKTKQFQFIDQPQRKAQNKIMLRIDSQEPKQKQKIITLADFKGSNDQNNERYRAFFNDQISRLDSSQKMSVKKLVQGIQYRKQRVIKLFLSSKTKFQSRAKDKQTRILIKNTTYPKFSEGTPYFTILNQIFDKQGNTLTMKIDDMDLKMGCKGSVFKQGQTYDFYIINLTMDDHPIHIHLINFQVIGRFKFDVLAYQNQWVRINGPFQPFGLREVPIQVDSRPFKTGQVEPPLQEQKLFIDTINVPAGYTTIARVRFNNHYGEQFPFNVTGSKYVWHCHILQHEDNEMMRYLCIE